LEQTTNAGYRTETKPLPLLAVLIIAYRQGNYDNFTRTTLDTPVGNAGLYFPCFNIQELRTLPTKCIGDSQNENQPFIQKNINPLKDETYL
jgi:hypothetical protein